MCDLFELKLSGLPLNFWFSDNFSGTPIKTGEVLGDFLNFPSAFTYLH
jgi:hypothetical protein